MKGLFKAMLAALLLAMLGTAHATAGEADLGKGIHVARQDEVGGNICKNIPAALAAKDYIGFTCFNVASEEDALEHIPTTSTDFAIGVLPHALVTGKSELVRDDLGEVAYVLVTRNPRLKTQQDVLALGRKLALTIHISGFGSSKDFLDLLFNADPEGFGQVVRNRQRELATPREMITELAHSNNGAVGLLIADPSSGLFSLAQLMGLTIIPLKLPQMLELKVQSKQLFHEGTFLVSRLYGQKLTTLATKRVLLAPHNVRGNIADRAEMVEMIDILRKVPAAALMKLD